MKFNIICVGSLKEAYWRDACAEYLKRLSRFATVTVTEIPNCKVPEKPSDAQLSKAIDAESEGLLAAIKPNDYVFALDVRGGSVTSEGMAKAIDAAKSAGYGSIDFVIGGSDGYNDTVRKRADKRISFGAITLPHQLFRVVLLEQIYRACKISSGEKYNK